MRKLSKRALWGIEFSFVAAPLPAVSASTPPSETLLCPGLSQPVEIIKDRWGISHIYAKSEQDLFFAQGYNVARDRLFQLEMWRRQATGTVAEILGPQEVERDLGNRLFLFRGDLGQEMNWYHPQGAQIIRAFTEGINAYIAETETHPALLTPEFKMLGIRPGKWTPAVVVSRFNGLLGRADQELMLALAIRAMGVEPVKDVMYFQPSDPKLAMDPAIDASLLTKEIMATFRAFRSPLRFTPEELLPTYRSRAATTRLDRAIPFFEDIRQGIGSNHWVVSGKAYGQRCVVRRDWNFAGGGKTGTDSLE